jgi:hypothetical protein
MVLSNWTSISAQRSASYGLCFFCTACLVWESWTKSF